MGLEQGRISESQLTMLVIGFTLGSSLLISPAGRVRQDSWIAVLMGLAEGLAIVFVYTGLAARFKGKSIIKVHDLVYGSVFGKVISILFLWYLFHLGSLVMSNFSFFFNTHIYQETPSTVIVISIALVTVYAVRHGLEVFARCGQLLVPFALFLIIMTVLLLFNQIRIEAFQPLLDVRTGELLWAAHEAAAFPFGETVAFLFALPYLNKPHKGRKSVVWGLIIAGLFLVLIDIRNTGALGVTRDLYVFPSLQAVRRINVGQFLTRVEIVIAVNFLTLGFLKICVVLYGAILGLAELLGLRSYRSVAYPVVIMMVILALLNFASINENLEFVHQGYPLYALPFQIGIPLLTLIIAFIRKLPREE